MKEKLNLKCIMQFGSSTYSKNPHDIDLAFFSKDILFSTKDILNLLEIIKKFELMYKDVVFDFSGEVRKKKGKYSITVIPLYDLEVNLSKNQSYSDSFFFKNLAEDKNKKILYGNDPFNFKIKITREVILDKLPIEIKHTLRRSLDSTKSRLNVSYHLFKTILRLMLVNFGVPKKEELLDMFKTNYKNIKLPKNSEKILKAKLVKSDFEDILKFAEDCLLYLYKN